jgi:hypothetical protein
VVSFCECSSVRRLSLLLLSSLCVCACTHTHTHTHTKRGGKCEREMGGVPEVAGP